MKWIILIGLAVALGFSIFGFFGRDCAQVQEVGEFVNPDTVIVVPAVVRPHQEFRGQDAIFLGEIKEGADTVLIKCSISDRNCIVTITVYSEEPQWVDREGEQLYQGVPKEEWLAFNVEGYHWLSIHRTLSECKCTVLEGSFDCQG